MKINYMQLDKFITESLNSIVKGIVDAQEFAKQNGARINPYVGTWDVNKAITTYYGNEDGARAVSTIDFDVAVTSSNEQETGGQGGIKVFPLQLSGKATDKEAEQVVSRIKFSINVALPNVKP